MIDTTFMTSVQGVYQINLHTRANWYAQKHRILLSKFSSIPIFFFSEMRVLADE